MTLAPPRGDDDLWLRTSSDLLGDLGLRQSLRHGKVLWHALRLLAFPLNEEAGERRASTVLGGVADGRERRAAMAVWPSCCNYVIRRVLQKDMIICKMNAGQIGRAHV